MRFATPSTICAAVPLLLACAACAVSTSTYPADAPARAANDVPEHFMVGSIAPGGPLSEPVRDGACRNPMVDPRDGTRLTLVQSQDGPAGQVGDYQVTAGRYGVASGELLRIDCGTGRAVGVVPRHG